MDFQVPSAIRPWSLQLNMEVSLWKRVKCFPSNVRLRKLKTQQSSVFWIAVEKITLLSWCHCFWKASFSENGFHPRCTKTQSRGFQIPPIWRVFSPRFGDGHRVDARPYRKNVDAFFKFHRCNLNQTWYFCWQLPCGTKVLQVLIFWLFSRFHFLQKKKYLYCRNLLLSDDEECRFVKTTETTN